MSAPRLTLHTTKGLCVPEQRPVAQLSVVEGGAPAPQLRKQLTRRDASGDCVTIVGRPRGVAEGRVVIEVTTRREDVPENLLAALETWLVERGYG